MIWENLGKNEILQGTGFHISYNPNTNAAREAGHITEIANLLGGFEDKTFKDGEETALYVEDKTERH